MERCFSDIVIVGSVDEQWEGAYVNGRLVMKDHKLDISKLLKALGFNVRIVLPKVEFDDGLPNHFSDIEKRPYFESDGDEM